MPNSVYTYKNLVSLALFMFLFIISNGKTIHTNPGAALESFKTTYKGQYDLTLPEKGLNKYLPIYVILPGEIEAKKYPEFRNAIIKTQLKDKKGIVFSPKMAWRSSYNSVDLETIIVDFISAAQNSFHIDSEKIVLLSFKKGAIQGMELTKNQDGLFSHSVIIPPNFKAKSKTKKQVGISKNTEEIKSSIHQAKQRFSAHKKLSLDIKFVSN
ncbi:hypothetical protein AB832_02485 [Flavobacteriaceae bacterium (ex Bugula neritina AB1)]|nr:hypothetical protein AB832_02485 [Flavobacteriaceae bacterium (ex Bugula neritina AB1)]